MDATHFRRRAAQAREIAQSGEDLRLTRMLLEVAQDLDAEAEAMEADDAIERCGFQILDVMETYTGRLHQMGPDPNPVPVQVFNLSTGGARFRVERTQTLGSKVILELTEHGSIRLEGSILRVRGPEAAMVFAAESCANAALGRLLQSTTPAERVRS